MARCLLSGWDDDKAVGVQLILVSSPQREDPRGCGRQQGLSVRTPAPCLGRGDTSVSIRTNAARVGLGKVERALRVRGNGEISTVDLGVAGCRRGQSQAQHYE